MSKPKKQALSVDLGRLFSSIAKGLVHGLTGKTEEIPLDIVDAAGAVSGLSTPESAASSLIQNASENAIESLAAESAVLIQAQKVEFPSELLDRIMEELAGTGFQIDKDFMKSPRSSDLIKVLQQPLLEWFEAIGIQEAQAAEMLIRLPSYITYELHKEWQRNPRLYASISQHLDTPFTEATDHEFEWATYGSFIERLTDQSIFEEAFGLRRLYVPLIGYYEKSSRSTPPEESLANDDSAESLRAVIDLEKNLLAWVKKSDTRDAIRVISGGPGAGKSSFCKMISLSFFREGYRCILIPLHHLDLKKDLVDAVGDYTSSSGLLSEGALLSQLGDRLILIFDGLDELALQGKAVHEQVQLFIREVQRNVDTRNQLGLRIQVILSGREVVVQEQLSSFRKDGAVLHLLPYFTETRHSTTKDYIDRRDGKRYVGEKGLIVRDQRNDWWQRYGEATGLGFSGLPKDLTRDDFTEVTAQPLLNYLVALAYVRKQVNFNESLNLNTIYESLLRAVYERGYENRPHLNLQEFKYDEFVRILEVVGLSAWHGGGRTTSVVEIEKHCESAGLKSLIGRLQAGADAGVLRLLAAFYFRQKGRRESGDKTFEFTHKSFGEYLVSRRLVRTALGLTRQVRLHEGNVDEGIDIKEALGRWLRECGPTAIDADLFKFVSNEIALLDFDEVENIQRMMATLIGYTLKQGLPFEALANRPSFMKEVSIARNSTEALFAIMYACARVTQKVMTINWPLDTSAGELIRWLQGQRKGPGNRLIMRCLAYIDFSRCILQIIDFYGANIEKSVFRSSDFTYSCMLSIDAEGADFEQADMSGVQFRPSSLRNANLEGLRIINLGTIDHSLSEEDANKLGYMFKNSRLTRIPLKKKKRNS